MEKPDRSWAPAVTSAAVNAMSRSSWVERAGYSRGRDIERLALIGASGPFTWLFLRADFGSRWFGWSLVAACVAMGAAALSAAYRVRCAVCGMHVYGYWLVGLPRRQGFRFDDVAECPFCGDDGTGTTGDPRLVGGAEEGARAVRRLIRLVAGGIVVLALSLLLALAMQWRYPWR